MSFRRLIGTTMPIVGIFHRYGPAHIFTAASRLEHDYERGADWAIVLNAPVNMHYLLLEQGMHIGRLAQW